MANIDYLDEDVAYLLGLLVARGELSGHSGVYRMIIRFPKSYLPDTNREIRLGMEKIRERILNVVGGDAQTLDAGGNWETSIALSRNTMAWRNVSMLLDSKTDFQHFRIPDVLFEPSTPAQYKREFICGFADAAGNIREANRDRAGRHRVYLDILNFPTNWHLSVELCLLLQLHLDVPVPNILWGHPNLNRQWREHQVRVYAEDFLKVGFYFPFKQALLEKLAEENRKQFPSAEKGCPGQRRPVGKKPRSEEEGNADRLPPQLIGKHFNNYWRICRALGCPRRPTRREQLQLTPVDEQ